MLKYTLRHKWYVFTYCLVWSIPIRGIFHDWSKFIPWIYGAYRRWFYGEWPSDSEALHQRRVLGYAPKWYQWSVKQVFDQAWNAHQKLEPHHWQYWLLIEDDRPFPRALEMPYKAVKHMVADWLGAARMHTDRARAIKTCQDWYLERRYKMNLHPRSRAAVEHLLNLYTDLVAGDEISRQHWNYLRMMMER